MRLRTASGIAAMQHTSEEVCVASTHKKSPRDAVDGLEKIMMGRTLSEAEYEVKLSLGVKVPMRDGVKLSGDIYAPDAEGKFPVILERTPYSTLDGVIRRMTEERGRYFAKRGYVYMIQDCRGKNDSDGEWYPVVNEGRDGYDTQEWVGTQPWSTGKVGMIGASYGAWVQLLSVVHGSRHLKCLVPIVLPADPWNYLPWQHGVFHLWFAPWAAIMRGRKNQSGTIYGSLEGIFKHLPLITMDEAFGAEIQYWKDWISHSTYDDYWRAQSYQHLYHKVRVPALYFTGWFDEAALGNHMSFIAVTKSGGSALAREHQKLIVGPWPHAVNMANQLSGTDFGPDATIDMNGAILRWYDHWLKGIDTGITDEPPVDIFVMGRNRWRKEREWPLARTRYRKYYFHSDGRANSLLGSGKLGPATPGDGEPVDHYTYDPNDPVPYVGGIQLLKDQPWEFRTQWSMDGAEDQRPVERRDDVLLYTSESLASPLEISGPISVELYAASSTRDTDFVVKIVDVFQNGYAMRLREGVIRARYREGWRHPTLIQPEKVYRYSIPIGFMSNEFQPGHRIRVEVTSSCFPKYDRNQNTGSRIGYDSECKIAQQSIFHEKRYPSHILLPLIPQARNRKRRS